MSGEIGDGVVVVDDLGECVDEDGEAGEETLTGVGETGSFEDSSAVISVRVEDERRD